MATQVGSEGSSRDGKRTLGAAVMERGHWEEPWRMREAVVVAKQERGHGGRGKKQW